MKSLWLPSVVFALTFAAFVLGMFFRGLDQAIFTPTILAVLLSAGIMLAGGWRGGWRVPASMPSLLLALFWLWMALALSWSRVPEISAVFTLLLGSIPLLFFAAIQHPQAARLIKAQKAAIAVAVALAGIWALAQFFFLSDLTERRIHHPMLNPNNLAVLLMIGVFMVLQVFAKARGVAALAAGAGIVMLICALMVTQSRGGTLGLICGLIALIVFCRVAILAEWRRFLALAVAGASAVSVFILLLISRYEYVRIVGGGGDAAGSANERLLLLRSGLKMMADHPFPGSGLGTFYLSFPPYRHPADLSDGYFLHIDPLQFGIEMSPVATLLFYGFCIAVLARTVHALRASAAQPQSRLALMLPFCGLVGLLINIHVNFDLYMMPAQMCAAVLLMVWYRASEDILGENRITLSLRNAAHRVFLIPFCFLLFVCAPVWTVRAGIGVMESDRSVQALQAGNLEEAAAHAAKAMHLGARSYYRAYYIDGLWRSQAIQKDLAALDPARRDEMVAEAMRSFDLSLRYNPYYTFAMNAEAFLYAITTGSGSLGLIRAQVLLEQALAIDPLNFDVRMGLARVHLAQGQAVRAAAVLEEGRKWDAVKRFAPVPYRIMLIQLYQAQGRAAEASALTEEMQNYIAAQQGAQALRTGIDRWVNAKIEMLLQR
ncbi:MAG: O-antigen ligase family protein [Micavibrio aeruginosavorus]|nr:O-antigen ligase family protein [Micavibrio aeruginosavorus]